MGKERDDRWRYLIVLLAACACAGSWAGGEVRGMQDRSERAKMTEKLKTVCVGRYLVDVPIQAEVHLSQGMLDGFAVETIEASESEFRQRVAARELRIENSEGAAGANPGSSLLARTADADAPTSADISIRMTKLRIGKRNMNGLNGEEVLERARELNFTTTYGFDWETYGASDDVLQPFVSLEMQTGISERRGGKPVDTSLHEDALLALWDDIASSIRLRKSDPPPPAGPLWDSISSSLRLRKNDPPPAAAPPECPGPKLGAVARAGDYCPQTGWWKCDAGPAGVDVHDDGFGDPPGMGVSRS